MRSPEDALTPLTLRFWATPEYTALVVAIAPHSAQLFGLAAVTHGRHASHPAAAAVCIAALVLFATAARPRRAALPSCGRLAAAAFPRRAHGLGACAAAAVDRERHGWSTRRRKDVGKAPGKQARSSGRGVKVDAPPLLLRLPAHRQHRSGGCERGPRGVVASHVLVARVYTNFVNEPVRF